MRGDEYRPSDDPLPQHVPARQRSKQRQFREVAQRSVEQTTDGIAVFAATRTWWWLSSTGRRTMARTDGAEEVVRFSLDFVDDERHGHEGQRPEQRYNDFAARFMQFYEGDGMFVFVCSARRPSL